MEPDLPNGSYGLFRRRRHYKVGDIILADHSRYGHIVKQIVDVTDKTVSLQGTHRDSVSRESMGPLPVDKILGTLVFTVRPSASRPMNRTQEI